MFYAPIIFAVITSGVAIYYNLQIFNLKHKLSVVNTKNTELNIAYRKTTSDLETAIADANTNSSIVKKYKLQVKQYKIMNDDISISKDKQIESLYKLIKKLKTHHIYNKASKVKVKDCEIFQTLGETDETVKISNIGF